MNVYEALGVETDNDEAALAAVERLKSPVMTVCVVADLRTPRDDVKMYVLGLSEVPIALAKAVLQNALEQLIVQEANARERDHH